MKRHTKRFAYAARGAWKRLWRRKCCPCCGNEDTNTVDRKFTYTLERCRRCKLLFRFPSESAEEMERYYETAYDQKGLTTQLPNDEELHRLLNNNFAGTEKDFSRVINLLSVLKVPLNARILDYGANWGYGALQFQRAGYRVDAYEISSRRAAFGRKLGIDIETDLAKLAADYDVIYSSHVLEHTANPLKAIREQLSRTRNEGFVIAHTPNGSSARRHVDFDSFHKHWGFIHPVLITDEFVIANWGDYPVFMSSHTSGGSAQKWNGREIMVDKIEGPELLLIIRNSCAERVRGD